MAEEVWAALDLIPVALRKPIVTYVNAYLQPTERSWVSGTKLQLSARGWEPFWGLEINPSRLFLVLGLMGHGKRKEGWGYTGSSGKGNSGKEGWWGLWTSAQR